MKKIVTTSIIATFLTSCYTLINEAVDIRKFRACELFIINDSDEKEVIYFSEDCESVSAISDSICKLKRDKFSQNPDFNYYNVLYNTFDITYDRGYINKPIDDINEEDLILEGNLPTKSNNNETKSNNNVVNDKRR